MDTISTTHIAHTPAQVVAQLLARGRGDEFPLFKNQGVHYSEEDDSLLGIRFQPQDFDFEDSESNDELVTNSLQDFLHGACFQSSSREQFFSKRLDPRGRDFDAVAFAAAAESLDDADVKAALNDIHRFTHDPEFKAEVTKRLFAAYEIAVARYEKTHSSLSFLTIDSITRYREQVSDNYCREALEIKGALVLENGWEYEFSSNQNLADVEELSDISGRVCADEAMETLHGDGIADVAAALCSQLTAKYGTLAGLLASDDVETELLS